MNSRQPGRFRILLANMLWLFSCISGWLAFLAASRNVHRAQMNALRRILSRQAKTDAGRRFGFRSMRSPSAFTSVPLTEYEDYAPAIERVMRGDTCGLTDEPIEALLPTSGSTRASKLIPYTPALRAEFRAGIDPWIASLFLANPSILLGRHYWAISPHTPYSNVPSTTVPVGFADDAEYLGPVQKYLSRVLFVLPGELARVADMDAFEYLTLLFLIRERNLRTISVWHPSFLTLLIDRIRHHFSSLLRDVEAGTIGESLTLDTDLRRRLTSQLAPRPARARELAMIETAAPDFPTRIWPCLRVISCWTDGRAEPWLSELAIYFPNSVLQGKGLIATEGIVSFPLGKAALKVCAVRSHFYEFIDTEDGTVSNAWNVQEGRTYSILLTTGSGFYRYKLHDIVRVTGFYNQAPCLTFISRDNEVSDLVGEKLNGHHVDQCIRKVGRELGLSFSFAMLAPGPPGEVPGYVFYVRISGSLEMTCAAIVSSLENLLCENYHYLHARRLLQLRPLRIFVITGDATMAYRDRLLHKGLKAGDIKFTSLSMDADWSTIFRGHFAGFCP